MVRRSVAFAFALTVLGYGEVARAWLSLTVRASDVTVQVEADGSAHVRHEMLLRVRGGPMKSLTLSGIDDDAEFTGEATLTRARAGEAAGTPLALVPTLAGDQAKFELVYRRGVRTGTYQLRFAYRTQLKDRGLIQRSGSDAELTWVGLKLDDGVASARVTFDLPAAASPPRTVGSSDDSLVGVSTSEAGVFLSELRREGERDRLTLTRPHVAKQERVHWTVVADGALFGFEPALAAAPVVGPAPESARQVPPVPWLGLLLGCGLSAVVTVLILLKARTRRIRFFVPLRTVVRAPLLFLLLFASVVAAVLFERATIAGGLLCSALVLMVHVVRAVGSGARAPGQWRPLEFDDLPPDRLPAAYRWLDIGHPLGVVSLLVVLGVGCVFALRLIGTAPFQSAMCLAYCLALAPLFCSIGEVSQSAVSRQRDVLLGLQERLEERLGMLPFGSHRLLPVGRFVNAASAPDEVRLSLELAPAKAGLIGVELGLEQHSGRGGMVSVPVVVVRVRDGSSAHASLPRNAQWSRGRQPDTRVALLRPALPNSAMAVDLVVSVLQSLAVDEERPSMPSASASKQPRKIRRQTRAQVKTRDRIATGPGELAGV